MSRAAASPAPRDIESHIDEEKDQQAQRFLFAFGSIQDHFYPKQHQLTAKRYRQQMRQRLKDWRDVAGLNSAG